MLFGFVHQIVKIYFIRETIVSKLSRNLILYIIKHCNSLCMYCVFGWKYHLNLLMCKSIYSTPVLQLQSTGRTSFKAASFGARFNTQSILADQLFPLCNIHTNIFRKSTQIFFTNIQTNIEGESRRIYCIQCSLNSGRVASSFSPEQFHSTQDFCLNQSIVDGTTSQKGFVLHVVVVENIAKVQS